MRFRWPQIRFTFLEFVLVPQEPADGLTDFVWGHHAGGQYEIAQESPEPEEEGFGFQ